MKKFMMYIFVGLLFCSLNSAQADLNFNLTAASGTWGTPVGGSNYTEGGWTDLSVLPEVPYGNNHRDDVLWGIPSTGSPGQSGLGFTGIAAPSVPITLGTPFEIGRLAHFNNPITRISAATAVGLTLDLTIANGEIASQSFNFQLQINETPNHDPFQSPLDDDIITFPVSFAAETITLSGQDYTLQLLGFGDDPNSLTSSYSSPEGGTNRVELWGQMTPVPVPGAFLLGSLGLGFAALRLKRRKTA